MSYSFLIYDQFPNIPAGIHDQLDEAGLDIPVIMELCEDYLDHEELLDLVQLLETMVIATEFPLDNEWMEKFYDSGLEWEPEMEQMDEDDLKVLILGNMRMKRRKVEKTALPPVNHIVPPVI